MIKIAITGSTGLIAKSIIYGMKGHSFVRINRKDFEDGGEVLYKKIKDADIVLNLAGATIIKRWTAKNKAEIYKSRILTTRKLVSVIGSMNRSVHLISASAIGIYDNKGKHDETSKNFSSGFVGELLADWEAEAWKGKHEHNRVAILRIGLVLSRDGGIIKRLMPLFKTGLGGTIGNGQQIMSFIHMDDLVRAIDYIIREKVEGIINMTAPEPLSNKEFTKVFGDLLHRPVFLKVPVFILKLMFGKGAEMILSGQHVIPRVLMEKDFTFSFPDIKSSLQNIIESA